MLALTCTLCLFATPAQAAPALGELAPPRVALALLADAPPPPPPGKTGSCLCGLSLLALSLIGLAVVLLTGLIIFLVVVLASIPAMTPADAGPPRPTALAFRL